MRRELALQKSDQRSTTYNFMSQGLSAICKHEAISVQPGERNSPGNRRRTGYRICERTTVATGKMTVGRVNDEFRMSKVL